jgi:hypothetical protein
MRPVETEAPQGPQHTHTLPPPPQHADADAVRLLSCT